MVQIAHPELHKDIKASISALEKTEEWLSENARSEDPKAAGMLIANSNKKDRLEDEVSNLKNSLRAEEQRALSYWQAHHKAEVAAVNIKAIRDVSESLDLIKGIDGTPAFKIALNKELGNRENDFKLFLHAKNTYPAYVDVLEDIKES